MKKIIKFLPVAAIVLGGSLALATTTKMEAPNVYKHPITGNWTPLAPTYPPGSYTCPDEGECTAFRDGSGNITEVTPGVFTPNPPNN
ncbi:hypothetical protein [Leadbetterella sp. DM7]|uniref:hypothetical protein n=1 Tax=Leadbetterella sp. DM7 TaxID=3235085 RepID=UPI00349EDC86